MMLSHREFLRRSVQRGELLAFAKELDWARIQYQTPFGLRSLIEGERQWTDCVFSSVQGRRDAWLQLVNIECRRIHARQQSNRKDQHNEL